MKQKSRTTVVINRYGMGDAPEELSILLLKNYLNLLLQEEILPSFICIYANGASIVTNGSPVIDELSALTNNGVKILTCKTCLNYIGKVEQVEVGTVATMLDIVGAQENSDKVITL